VRPDGFPEKDVLNLPDGNILTQIQEYGLIKTMKATVEIPDALYRRVKSKSAMEQRTIREVTVALYRRWVESSLNSPDRSKKKSLSPAWFGAARSYAEQVERHDMESIRHSIAKGRTV
jgi:hypothetical protein